MDLKLINMNKYYNVQTGEEVLLNKPLEVSFKDDNYSINFSTNSLEESFAEYLVANKILTYSKPSLVPTDIEYYIHKLAKKLNISMDECRNMLNNLTPYTPATVFSLLVKQIALELDAQYEGHICKSPTLYGINLCNGDIFRFQIKKEDTISHIAAFRTIDDAVFAIGILKDLYTAMFKK